MMESQAHTFGQHRSLACGGDGTDVYVRSEAREFLQPEQDH